MSSVVLFAVLIGIFCLYVSIEMWLQQRVLNEAIERVVALEAELRIGARNLTCRQVSKDDDIRLCTEIDACCNPETETLDLEKKCFDEYGLTDREKEILHYLLLGKDSCDICELLVLSNSTVKSHIYNIYRKLGAHSRREVVDLFEKQGLSCQLCRI